jgi:hypothetical protein
MLDLFPPIWNGTLREHYLLLFSAAGAFGLGFGLVGAWLGARFAAARTARQIVDALARSEYQQASHQRLADLSLAVDAMSVEIERLSEGQRYAAKLLTERAHPAPVELPQARTPGTITPH